MNNENKIIIYQVFTRRILLSKHLVKSKNWVLHIFGTQVLSSMLLRQIIVAIISVRIILPL